MLGDALPPLFRVFLRLPSEPAHCLLFLGHLSSLVSTPTLALFLGLTMNRIDVLLADLPAHLAELRAAASFDEQKLVLVTACEQSTLLPCCGQSLGMT